MSDKAKKAKVKDLDPKGQAQDVKGGCLCCPDVGFAGRALRDGKDKVGKAPNPR